MTTEYGVNTHPWDRTVSEHAWRPPGGPLRATVRYAGDRPVTVPSGGYGQTGETVSTLIGELSETGPAPVLSATARALYRVAERVR